jgi:5'-nucleotidase
VKILLVNDDGIEAPGLLALVETLSVDHTLAVVAPDTERSGASHSITLKNGVAIQRSLFKGFEQVSAWAISGTPADCVRFAVDNLLDWRPELVVSGMNRGANTGFDIRYSGTVAAALEAASISLSSIAVSLNTYEDGADFRGAAALFAELLPLLVRPTPASPRRALNVNIPAIARSLVKGVKVTRSSGFHYKNEFESGSEPDGRVTCLIRGVKLGVEEDTDYDICALAAGYVSVSPLSLDFTAHDEIASLKESLAPSLTMR